MWDGDPECEHQWGDSLISNEHAYATKKRWQHKEQMTEKEKKNLPMEKVSQCQYCQKCGAWLGCLGLEPNFELFIKHLADIYDIVMRKLKKTGTCWVNLGDSYSGGGSGGHHNKKPINKQVSLCGVKQTKTNIPSKCLLMIPQRFAIEMISRGWILRNVIIWHKPNAMPNSAKDRFTVDFEYVYFFVKRKKYVFTQQKELLQESSKERMKYPRYSENSKGMSKEYAIKTPHYGKCEKYWFEQQRESITQSKGNLERRKYQPGKTNGKITHSIDDNVKPNSAFNQYWSQGRNKRCVWTIPTSPNPEAHFATFPPKLVKPMILSGCPEFVCSKCGKARERIIKKEYLSKLDNSISERGMKADKMTVNIKRFGDGIKNIKTLGYTDCGCNAPFVSGIVLDPFAGTGTTLKTAFELGRDFIGFEISKEYVNTIAKKFLDSTKNRRLTDFV